MVAPLGEEYPLANEEYLEYDPVEFTLRNDTLHIGGYLRNDCAGPLYMFVEEKADKIFLSTYELPEDADCYSFYKIDVNITGLSKDKYTIVYQGKTFEVVQRDNSIEEAVMESVMTPLYDLQGRPVAAPTRGIYIKDGKKVVVK
jgi:hypothetical protein